MALRSLSRFVCTFLLVLSLLSVTNRALSVTSEQVCQGLNNVISNTNSGTLTNCVRDSNCTVVQCQVIGITANFIQRATLTLLPCQDPPSVRLQLLDPAMQVFVDQVINETQTIVVNTAGGSLPLMVFINRTTDTEIGIKIDYDLGLGAGVQTLINFTSVPVDTSMCETDGPTPVETTGSQGVSTTMAVDTTQTLESTTSQGTATTLITSKFSLALVLTLCLLIISLLHVAQYS